VPQFTTNADRIDPYKNFKFVVVWDGTPVAGVSRVGALTRSTQVVTHREAATHIAPGSRPGRPTTALSHWSGA
jgi:hypothetical protein